MPQLRRAAMAVPLVGLVSALCGGQVVTRRLPPETPPQLPPATARPARLDSSAAHRCDRPIADTSSTSRHPFAATRPLIGCTVAFGVEAGPAQTTFAGAGNAYSYGPGFAVGSYLLWTLGDPLSVQAEVQYARRSVSVSRNGTTTALSLNDAEVPLLLRVSNELNGRVGPASGQQLGLFAELGPDLSLHVSCGSAAKATQGNATSSCASNGLSTANYGVMGGFGTDVALLGHTFTAVARYDAGIGAIKAPPGSSAQNRGANLLLGVRW